MMITLLLLVLAGLSHAQPVGLTVSGVTQTQAILRYTAPSASACTIEVSTASNFATLVADVDPALFASSNSDTRFSSLAVGLQRTFIVGARSSGLAADGRLYSRALAQNNGYYYRVTCGGFADSGQFATRPLAWGALSTELPPFHASGFGNYGWPTIDWGDKLRWYTDPMTGFEYKPVTFPGEYAQRYPSTGAFLFGSADFVVGSWTNAGNVRSGSASSVASTSGTSALYVGIDPTVTTPALQNLVGIDGKAISLDNIQVDVYGSGTDATAANRQIAMCWSLDWATCYTSSITVTLGTGADALVGAFPAEGDFVSPFFGGWGKPISRIDIGRTGTVDVSGTTATVTTGNQFHFGWITGTRIWISGSAPTCANNLCTVSVVTSPTTATLVESLSLTGSTYKAAPALRIAKVTGTGSVNVSVAHRVAISNAWSIPPGGSIESCSIQKVTFSVDRDGVPSSPKSGRMCAFDAAQSEVGAIYWVADDGESRLISVFRVPVSVVNSADPRDFPKSGDAYPYLIGFDRSVGTRWYTHMKCANGGLDARCIFALNYVGDGRQWKPSPLYPTGGAGLQPASPSDNVEWSILTPPSLGLDVQSQVDVHFPTYDKSRWGDLKTGVDGAGVTGNLFLIVKQGWGVGESPAAFMFTFDVTTGLFVRGWDTFTGSFSPFLKFGAAHATLALGGPNYEVVLVALNEQQLLWGAHTTAVTHVRRSGVYDSNTALPATFDGSYDGACDTNPYGVTGNSCVFVKIEGTPCKVANLSGDSTWYPCPHNAARVALAPLAVGDYVYDTATLDNGERLRVLAKTETAVDEWEVMLHRDSIPSSLDPRCIGSRAHTNGWTMAANFGGGRTCEVSTLFVEPRTGSVYASPLFDHFDIGVGTTTDLRWVSSAAYADGGLAQMLTTFPPVRTPNSPAFAGTAANAIPPVQSYPSGRQWSAPASERDWTTQHRHYTQWGYQTLTQISGNLYRVSTYGTPDVKRLGWTVTAGGMLLQEKNPGTTGDTIGPADTWKYCYALRNNECRSGSTAGQMFVVVPAPLTTNTLCDEGVLSVITPCAAVSNSYGAWGLQEVTTRNNASGRWIRRLTMQPGPQRQPAYENVRPMPDGEMVLWRSSWTDGLYSAVMIGKLPRSLPDTINRTTWQSLQVNIGAGVVANNALVRFWYDEHGGYCSSRQEACYASAAAVTESNPFLYTHELASGSGVACASGCTLSIPAISNRVLYYEVVNNASGSLSTVVGSRSAVAVH